MSEQMSFLEDLDPTLYNRLAPGDSIVVDVAGRRRLARVIGRELPPSGLVIVRLHNSNRTGFDKDPLLIWPDQLLDFIRPGRIVPPPQTISQLLRGAFDTDARKKGGAA